MALSFISNIWNSSPSLQPNPNHPDLVGFQQRKKPRFTNLSFSNTYYNNNPSTSSFNAKPLALQNNNSFFSHHNNFTTTTPNNNTFFNSLSSPQTLFPFQELHNPYPYENHVSDPFFNGYSSNHDGVSDFLTDEDRILLAPLLSEPQVCDFPVPQDNVVYDCGNGYIDRQEINTTDEVKKPSASSSTSTSTAVSPQSIAARERRRKITEKTQELGKLIPGGNKMSTAEMFQAAYKYVKFLQAQVSLLQSIDSSIREKNEEPLHIKELQVLASPVVQQNLYSEDKCLVPKTFVDKALANRPELGQSNSF